MSRRGFTLIELLVVVAIIAILISIVMPAMAAARRSGEAATCLSQMREIGMATSAYMMDNDDYFPRSSHSALAYGVLPWGYAIIPYLGRGVYTGPGPDWDELFNKVYRCRQDPRRDCWSYGKNVWFELASGETGELAGTAEGPTYTKSSDVIHPSTTILYGELGSGSMGDHIMAHFWYLGGIPEVDAKRHGATSNYAYVDGHADAQVFKSTFDQDAGIDLWKPGPLVIAK
ncbi:MAG TPA: type II secretion system protein [Phycisphaerae bacterium]|nr:type II secretion system protein [Phycisphaerae bacterium]